MHPKILMKIAQHPQIVRESPLAESLSERQISFLEDASRMAGPRKIRIAREWAEKNPDKHEKLVAALRDAFRKDRYLVTSKKIIVNGEPVVRSTINFKGPTGLQTELVNYKNEHPQKGKKDER